MAVEFDLKELAKLPPALRLAKIKQLKAEMQKQVEKEAAKLEEDSQKQIVSEQKELEELIKLREEEAAEERAKRESEEASKRASLESTVRKEAVNEEQKSNAVDYNTRPTNNYALPQNNQTGPQGEPLFNESIGPKDLKPNSIYNNEKSDLYRH
jgi:septal ring factor EnvC (AmiA/AmiB activator)